MTVVRLPIYWTSSIAMSSHVPAVSIIIITIINVNILLLDTLNLWNYLVAIWTSFTFLFVFVTWVDDCEI